MALHLGLGFDVSHCVLTHEALFQRGLLNSAIIELNSHDKHPPVY